MTRRGVIGLLTGGTAALLGGCWPFESSETLRHRLTVEVDTPDGLKTGMGVIQSTITKGPRTGGASGISYQLRGEAVAVDLPGGRTLFALLRGGSERDTDAADYQADLLERSIAAGAVVSPPLPRRYEPGDWRELRQAARAIKPSVVVPPAHIPFLVTFVNIRDPKSVERVDPVALDKSFGAGVTLRQITLSVTDDPVTTGIEKRFIWWDRFRERHFDGTSSSSRDLTTTNISARMSSRSFSTEVNQ